MLLPKNYYKLHFNNAIKTISTHEAINSQEMTAELSQEMVNIVIVIMKITRFQLIGTLGNAGNFKIQ